MAGPGAGSGLPSPGLLEGPFGLILLLPQIQDFLRQLKGRVLRRATRRMHPGGPQGPRRRETQTPAPIEVRRGEAPQGRPLEDEVGVGGITWSGEPQEG